MDTRELTTQHRAAAPAPLPTALPVSIAVDPFWQGVLLVPASSPAGAQHLVLDAAVPSSTAHVTEDADESDIADADLFVLIPRGRELVRTVSHPLDGGTRYDSAWLDRFELVCLGARASASVEYWGRDRFGAASGRLEVDPEAPTASGCPVGLYSTSDEEPVAGALWAMLDHESSVEFVNVADLRARDGVVNEAGRLSVPGNGSAPVEGGMLTVAAPSAEAEQRWLVVAEDAREALAA